MAEAAPRLVAHRGYPARFPENTLEGITAALETGVRYVEFDVQLSGDGVPVVLHDPDLSRTAGAPVKVFDTTLAELRRYPVGEPARFGDRYSDARLPALAEVLSLLGGRPGVQAFVEIKRHDLRRFGRAFVLEAVLKVLSPYRDQCIIISFDRKLVEMAKAASACRTGWAVRSLSARYRDLALRLAPEFLFLNVRLLPAPPAELWPGSWEWVAYTVNDPAALGPLAARGVDYVETDAIGEMPGYETADRGREGSGGL